jgi:hypothetical protein
MCCIRQSLTGLANFDRSATILARNLDPNNSALKRDKSSVPIDIWIVRGQPLFCAGFCGFGAGKVNLRGTLGGFRQHGDAVA